MISSKLKAWIIGVLQIAIANSLIAQTNVSGLISSNTTWTLAGSPYIVTGNILVNNGVTLTIEPGVTVRFDSTKVLQINGGLIAIGTAQSRITFTANDVTPAKGSWGRIQFAHNSTDAVFDILGNYVSGSIMKYCDIQYGGGVAGDVTVFCDTSAPYFSHCRISDCLKHAIYFVNAVGRVESSSIRNCVGTAVSYVNPVSVDLILTNDTLEDNGGGVIHSGTGLFTGITIQNCIFTRSGIAIKASGSSNTTIENNVFTYNSMAVEGNLGTNVNISDNQFTGQTNGVLGVWKCVDCGFFSCNEATLKADSLTVANNYFDDNTGAMYVLVSYALIQGNTFLNNRLQYTVDCEGLAEGGILLQLDGGPGLVINNVFDGNTGTSYFGGVIWMVGEWEIANNIFRNNISGMVGYHNATISYRGTANVCSNRFLNNPGSVIAAYFVEPGPFIHHNDFINNSSGSGVIFSQNNNSIIHNNEFQGNSCSGNPMISMENEALTISYNKFLNNSTSGCPVISVIDGNADIHHNKFTGNQHPGSPIISISDNSSSIYSNDFRNNTGLSCVQIMGSTMAPTVMQNNFVNPGVQYELENLIPFAAFNLNVPDNYWGSTNPAHVDSVIKDFFDDGNLSLAVYTPVLASPAIIDTSLSCFPDTNTVALTGNIHTENGFYVQGVSVTISGDYNLLAKTNATGEYNFYVPRGGNYTITPSKNNDVIVNNGISTIDILLMQRHILGNALLSSPYKIIAAAECNADGNTQVSTIDLLYTRQLILNSALSFPTNRLWQFVPSDYVFPDNTHPFPFPTTRTYTNITTNQTNQNFIGIKLGDVNGNWDANTP